MNNSVPISPVILHSFHGPESLVSLIRGQVNLVNRSKKVWKRNRQLYNVKCKIKENHLATEVKTVNVNEILCNNPSCISSITKERMHVTLEILVQIYLVTVWIFFLNVITLWFLINYSGSSKVLEAWLEPSWTSVI